MPNYCFNSIYINGPKDQIQAFHERWIKPANPLHDKVILPTLRILDMCAIYAAMEDKLNNTHGKQKIRDIIHFAYMNISDIDFLDQKENLITYPFFKRDGVDSFNDYFKEFIKNIYEIMNLSKKQLANRRLLREKWYEAAEPNKYSFHNLVEPPPLVGYREGLPIPEVRGYNDQLSAYYFNLLNLGQKWTFPADLHIEQITDTSILCQFETAWSPADIFLAKISEMYPKLEFDLECNEPGMMIAGRLKYFAGDLIEQDWYDGQSYAGFHLFQDWADEDIVRDMKDNMEMTLEDIIDDCEGYISKENIYKHLNIRKAKAIRLDKI